jgi:hypothetical protein
MSSLRVHISTSLDGYVAGPRQSEENPLGEGGEPPFHKPVFVLTHHPREPLTPSDTTSTQACGSTSAARSTRPGSRSSGTAW